MVTNPRFLRLDEPFAGLDPLAVNEVFMLVRKAAAREVGVLITDHNVREALRIIEHGLIPNEGRVIVEGSPKEYPAPRTRESFTWGPSSG